MSEQLISFPDPFIDESMCKGCINLLDELTKVQKELADERKIDGHVILKIRTDCAAEIDRLRAGIIKARDALDNYDYDTSLFDIMSELDNLLGDTE